ncbi:phosducin-like protein, putative (PhLP2) [Plasmodium malariae]|uniref:Phosducin-like protein, putative (PhLP2) n=1 Tax=Plasmodium malariae TaxID=5858 RepID=A0A1A8VSL0_PLAMA|nr:phosducin-like protein, putative (PhLP2) [Plasmodium malariae]
MIPKNKLTDICATLTLEKAKENLANERKFVEEKRQHVDNGLHGQWMDEQKDVKSSSLTNENSDEEEIRKWREKRLTQLKKKQELKKDGVYIEISEKEFIPTVLKNYNVVCHFYDSKANNCQFFMNKLNIKILPSLCLFIEGVLIKTCIDKDNFKTKDLEGFLFKKKLINNMEYNESDEDV